MSAACTKKASACSRSAGATGICFYHSVIACVSKQQQFQGTLADIDPRSNGGKQHKLTQSKAPEVVLELLKEVKTAQVPAHHVLFDFWCCSPASLHQIHELGYDIIARVKKSEKLRFPALCPV